jgi:hypothetical protein
MSCAVRPWKTTSSEFILNPFEFFFTHKSRRMSLGGKGAWSATGQAVQLISRAAQYPGRAGSSRPHPQRSSTRLRAEHFFNERTCSSHPLWRYPIFLRCCPRASPFNFFCFTCGCRMRWQRAIHITSSRCDAFLSLRPVVVLAPDETGAADSLREQGARKKSRRALRRRLFPCSIPARGDAPRVRRTRSPLRRVRRYGRAAAPACRGDARRRRCRLSQSTPIRS